LYQIYVTGVYEDADILQEDIASMNRLKFSENEGSRVLRNICNIFPDYSVMIQKTGA
jgi:hypothetical protein